MKDALAKLLFDFLSAIVFLVLYLSTGNVVLATSVAIAGAVAQVIYSRIKAQPLGFIHHAQIGLRSEAQCRHATIVSRQTALLWQTLLPN